MSEPVIVSIPESELIDWIGHIKTGMNPTVEFNHKSERMLKEAFKQRGDQLYYLKHRIMSYISESERSKL